MQSKKYAEISHEEGGKEFDLSRKRLDFTPHPVADVKVDGLPN